MRKRAKDVVLGMLTSKEMIEELELMKESGVLRRQISGRIGIHQPGQLRGFESRIREVRHMLGQSLAREFYHKSILVIRTAAARIKIIVFAVFSVLAVFQAFC